jgi:hypothetical protein
MTTTWDRSTATEIRAQMRIADAIDYVVRSCDLTGSCVESDVYARYCPRYENCPEGAKQCFREWAVEFFAQRGFIVANGELRRSPESQARRIGSKGYAELLENQRAAR